MSFIFIHEQLKNKDNINLNINRIEVLKLFQLSIGNSIIKSKYPYISNKKISNNKFLFKLKTLKQNVKVINRKKLIEKNIVKMIYKTNENNKEIKIFNKLFISSNIKRAKVIINNKQYDLKENIKSKIKKIYKIKIKFFDNIIKLNYMFKDCESLSSVYNLHNLNAKYLKSLRSLFYGCGSLLNIEYISNNLYIKDINVEYSSVDQSISKWNICNVNNISGMFYECSSLKHCLIFQIGIQVAL